MMLLSLAGAGLVATIFVVASSSLPEGTRHEQNLHATDHLFAYRLERGSRSLSRLVETVDTMNAEHERALSLGGRISDVSPDSESKASVHGRYSRRLLSPRASPDA
jgi:hypothetical protein